MRLAARQHVNPAALCSEEAGDSPTRGGYRVRLAGDARPLVTLWSVAPQRGERVDTRAPSYGAVADLSNICCSEVLGGSGDRPAWSAFSRVLNAWDDYSGSAPLLAIADANLRFRLPEPDLVLMKRALRLGKVREVPSPADADLLDEAERTGALVISMDKFVDYRNEHPWLQGNSHQILGWRVSGTGTVVLEPRDMGVCSSYSISKAEERGQLKARQLFGRATRALLAREYRCDSTRPCLQRSLSPDRLQVLPILGDDGSPICPSCTEPLMDIGPRLPGIEVKVRPLPDGATMRVRLIDGDKLVLGRETSGVVDLTRGLADSDVLKVSRRHLEVRVNGTTLEAVDPGSTNGTWLYRWSDASRAFGPPARIETGTVVVLGQRDRLSLAQVVRVERSAQQYPTATPPADSPRLLDQPASIVVSHPERT